MNANSDLDTCIVRVVHDALGAMLGLDIQEAQENASAEGLESGGIVHILGDWMGSIAFRCSPALVEIFTKRMFHLESETSSKDQRDEVTREVANMLGGNLKSILGKKCVLSVPKTLEHLGLNGDMPDSKRIADKLFHCSGEPLLITVYESPLDIPKP